MKIAVVGGGVFGTTAAIKLKEAGYEVDLYEQNSDIFCAASGINQYRLHRGYHYPRSKTTALSARYAEDSFREDYGEAVMDENDHYYAIATEGSRVNAEKYLNFCKECELEHEKTDLDQHFAPGMVELVVKGKEAVFDPVKLKEIIWAKLKKLQVKVHLNTPFTGDDIDRYDFVVNATYANSNFILEKYPELKREYQFELVEKPVVRLPEKFRGKSIVIMDGPFFCIDPYSSTDLHVMGNVVHTIHATNTGFYPEIPEAYKPLLNRGVVKNPLPTNIGNFFKVAESFLPDFKHAEHVGSMFTIRTVLPNLDTTDERATWVSRLNDKIIHLFSGKIGNCVEAGYEVVRIIESAR